MKIWELQANRHWETGSEQTVSEVVKTLSPSQISDELLCKRHPIELYTVSKLPESIR